MDEKTENSVDMQKLFFLFLILIGSVQTVFSQCEFALDEVDEFDSLRLIAAHPVAIGYKIPSNYKTAEGNTMIDEGKALFSFSEGDTINSFFLSLGIMEREYLPVKPGVSVFLKLSNNDIVGLLNAPDRGQFDDQTNMRLYTHTCIVPVDYYPAMADYFVQKIRIEYKNHKRTIILSDEQQKLLQQAIQCIGEAVNFYPTKP